MRQEKYKKKTIKKYVLLHKGTLAKQNKIFLVLT